MELNDARDQATRLETLMPRVMRVMFRSHEDDPLGDLPVAQLRMVRLLAIEPRTVTGVGELLGLTPSAVTQMANRLQDAGLVERASGQSDRRVRPLQLTVLGRHKVEKRHAQRVASAERVLMAMEPAQVEALMSGLEAIAGAIVELEQPESLNFLSEIEPAHMGTTGDKN